MVYSSSCTIGGLQDSCPDPPVSSLTTGIGPRLGALRDGALLTGLPPDAAQDDVRQHAVVPFGRPWRSVSDPKNDKSCGAGYVDDLIGIAVEQEQVLVE